MSISALSQSEEKIKWRQDENDIDGEHAVATAKSSSPTSVAAILSRNVGRHGLNPNSNPSQQQQIAGRNTLPGCQAVYSPNAGKKAKGPVANYYVMLEKSPPRISSEESDTSTYDKSFHCRETDSAFILSRRPGLSSSLRRQKKQSLPHGGRQDAKSNFCQDSTDYDSSSGGTESFTTEEMETIDFLEYEVASASDNDANSVHNSSSGTDDHGLHMTAVGTLGSSSSSSDFADSEESDSDKLFDKELSEADYWDCIQCRNPNNNPLYPMCEKCYKIRRTHFPPRPRPRKKLNRRRKLALSPSGVTAEKLNSNISISSTQEEAEVSQRLCSNISGKGGFKSNANRDWDSFKRRKLNYSNSKSQLNSAAETSDEDEDFCDRELTTYNEGGSFVRKRKSPMHRYRRGTVSTNVSSSGQSSLDVNNKLEAASLSRKRSFEYVEDSEVSKAKQARRSCVKSVSNAGTASDTDNESTVLITRSEAQKDSGISSAPSSQEPASSSLSDERTTEKEESPLQDGSETVGSESLNEKLVEALKETKSDISAELSSDMIFSGIKHSSLIRSVSDFSNTLSKNFSAKAFSVNMNNLDSSFSMYGSCSMCLSGPKNGVFVHSNNVHLCSCYKCAVRIWSKDKKCPVCNVSAKNVLKLFVH